MNFGDPRLPERFWAKCVPEPHSGCWIWTGTMAFGYGVSFDKGRRLSAHRHAYESLHGEIPIGLEIDHKCETKCCCNPSHLEAVTHRENMRRSAARNPERIAKATRTKVANKTHCKNGHEFTADNIVTYPCAPRTRRCRICEVARIARRPK